MEFNGVFPFFRQLHIAVVQGYIEATFCLVNMAPHPCLLDILNDDGQTALHLSILTHQPRIARCLILAGANPEARNIKGNTALHLACACGDIDSARALTDPLSHGERGLHLPGRFLPALPQNLEQRNYNGEFFLFFFLYKFHTEFDILLINSRIIGINYKTGKNLFFLLLKIKEILIPFRIVIFNCRAIFTKEIEAL